MATKATKATKGTKASKTTRTVRKGSRASSIDGRLQALVADHVESLVAALSQAVRTQMADDVARALGGAVAAPGRAVRAIGRPKRRNIKPCIAPSCSNPSKGPRFHYLCEKHRSAPKRDYETWRKTAQGKKSDASAG